MVVSTGGQYQVYFILVYTLFTFSWDVISVLVCNSLWMFYSACDCTNRTCKSIQNSCKQALISIPSLRYNKIMVKFKCVLYLNKNNQVHTPTCIDRKTTIINLWLDQYNRGHTHLDSNRNTVDLLWNIPRCDRRSVLPNCTSVYNQQWTVGIHVFTPNVIFWT